MNHEDHVNLLRGGVPTKGGIWADFGSGDGAFTLALADLIGESGIIYSVDRDGGALRQQEKSMAARFPGNTVHYITSDFAKPLDLPALDGIVMANSLHFQRAKDSVLRQMRGYLKPGGHFLLVEYNADSGNMWVPFPLSYPTWETLAAKNGFKGTHLLATVPSRFLGEIFSAASTI
jgi:ubiquinone/menaquinone biosynthesis C-methylase UbiE